MRKNLFVLALGALFVGCDAKDTGETGTDDTMGGDDTAPIATEINTVSYGYTDTEWSYEAELIGWGSGATLDIYQSEGGYEWDESHDLEQMEYDPNGEWDKWGITLPIVTDWQDQQDGVNTLFSGDSEMESTMTWMVTAYDMDGNFADCAVWGKRIEYYASYGCWEVAF